MMQRLVGVEIKLKRGELFLLPNGTRLTCLQAPLYNTEVANDLGVGCPDCRKPVPRDRQFLPCSARLSFPDLARC